MSKFSPIGKKTQGRDFNFFKRLSITNTTFGLQPDGYVPDIIIPFQTAFGGVIFTTEETSPSSIIEYSFNGSTVHGELIPGSARASLTFYHRPISMVWFRVKSGSPPLSLTVEAWGT